MKLMMTSDADCATPTATATCASTGTRAVLIVLCKGRR